MERILLVEDEKINMAILSAQLRRAGYIVEEAVDGAIAWEKLQLDSGYDLVVTDRRMPNMDGDTLFAQMQTVEGLSSIPVIMQTAASAPDEVVEGIKIGVYYYLLKPYEEDTLLTLVKSAIRQRKRNEWFESRLKRQEQAMGTFVRGEFRIRTLDEAQNIAFLLGALFPRPELAISGLYELLLNAIEHGNLRIGYQEKGRLLAFSQWEEEIIRRLSSPENASKRVCIQFVQDTQKLEVMISDQGGGFDWKPFMEIEPSRAMRANGRGIAKANLLSFDELSFRGKGNEVHVLTKLAK